MPDETLQTIKQDREALFQVGQSLQALADYDPITYNDILLKPIFDQIQELDSKIKQKQGNAYMNQFNLTRNYLPKQQEIPQETQIPEPTTAVAESTKQSLEQSKDKIGKPWKVGYSNAVNAWANAALTIDYAVAGILGPATPAGSLYLGQKMGGEYAKYRHAMMNDPVVGEYLNSIIKKADVNLKSEDLPSGKYAEPPKDWTGYFDPMRAYMTIAQNTPLMGSFVVANAINPAMATLLMGAVEAGDALNTIKEYEKRTGQKVDEDTKAMIIGVVGSINGSLEKVGLNAVLGKIPGAKGLLARIIVAPTVEGTTEGLQEISQMLGEQVYGQASDLDWKRFIESAYGGLLLGFLGGGVSGISDYMAETVKSEGQKTGGELDYSKAGGSFEESPAGKEQEIQPTQETSGAGKEQTIPETQTTPETEKPAERKSERLSDEEKVKQVKQQIIDAAETPEQGDAYVKLAETMAKTYAQNNPGKTENDYFLGMQVETGTEQDMKRIAAQAQMLQKNEIPEFGLSTSTPDAVALGMALQNNPDMIPEVRAKQDEAGRLFKEAVKNGDEKNMTKYSHIGAMYREAVETATNEGGGEFLRNYAKERGIKPLFQKPMEETGDLLVLHNIRDAGIQNVDRLGGLPVPSLAITNKNAKFDGYGEITLIADKKLIDPERSSLNKVYNADIYSPRYPIVTVEFNKYHEQRAFEKEIFDLGKSIFPELKNIDLDIENALKGSLSGNDAIIAAYLADNNIDLKLTGDRYEKKKQISEYVWGKKGQITNKINEWLQTKLQKYDVRERIFQGFTYSGNRKYKAHNLENVVNILKKELRNGENFNYGAGSVRSVLTKKFRSIKDIKKQSGKLVKSEQEAESFNKFKEESNNALFDLAEKYKNNYTYDKDNFGYADRFSEALIEGAKNRNIPKALKEWGWENIDDYKPIYDFFEKLANAPTEYFEAKIQRAVDLSEFSAAVVPNTISAKSRKILEEKGIKVYEYSNPDQRKEQTVKAAERNKLLFQEQQAAPVFYSNDITKEMRNSLITEGQPLFQGYKGAIQFQDDGKAIITIFKKNSDASTLLHELFHYARMKGVLNQYDNSVLLKATGEKTWTTKAEEKAARMWERYMREGKAPTPELQRVFERIKEWLREVYKTIKNSPIDVPLTAEVRDIFDKMLGGEKTRTVKERGSRKVTPAKDIKTVGDWVKSRMASIGQGINPDHLREHGINQKENTGVFLKYARKNGLGLDDWIATAIDEQIIPDSQNAENDFIEALIENRPVIRQTEFAAEMAEYEREELEYLYNQAMSEQAIPEDWTIDDFERDVIAQMNRDAGSLKQDFEELGKLQKDYKSKQMIFDYDRKNEVSRALNVPFDYVNLPYNEWNNLYTKFKKYQNNQEELNNLRSDVLDNPDIQIPQTDEPLFQVNKTISDDRVQSIKQAFIESLDILQPDAMNRPIYKSFGRKIENEVEISVKYFYTKALKALNDSYDNFLKTVKYKGNVRYYESDAIQRQKAFKRIEQKYPFFKEYRAKLEEWTKKIITSPEENRVSILTERVQSYFTDKRLQQLLNEINKTSKTYPEILFQSDQQDLFSQQPKKKEPSKEMEFINEQREKGNAPSIGKTLTEEEKKKAYEKRQKKLEQTGQQDIFGVSPGQGQTTLFQKGDELISDAQSKRLYAIANAVGIKPEAVKKIANKYGYESTKDILVKDYEKIISEIEQGNPNQKRLFDAKTDAELRKRGVDPDKLKNIVVDFERIRQNRPTPKEYYDQVRQDKTIDQKVKDALKSERIENKGIIVDTFVPISTRLGLISPVLKRALRKFEGHVNRLINGRRSRVEPLLKALHKMSKEDQRVFDLATKNRDNETIQELARKYKFENDYQAVRNVLDELHKEASDVGFDLGYLMDYWPRSVKNTDAFMQYIYQTDAWGAISEAIRQYEDMKGEMSQRERAEFINKLVRGYIPKNITLSKTSNMKIRQIELVTPEMSNFYYDSNTALLKYIDQVTEAIEARKFFGKGEDLENSIGRYIRDLIDNNEIKPIYEEEVTSILRARFNYVHSPMSVSTFKNLGYITTMGSFKSAITQIGDLAWAWYNAGTIQTGKALSKAIAGKSEITRQDIGIERIAEEFSDVRKLAKVLQNIFKYVGLTKIDMLGKETLINATLQKYRNDIKSGKNTRRIDEKLNEYFGDEAEQVKQDIISGKINDNTLIFAFNVLSDFQPITLSEMPKYYLTSPKGRVFYMLKTFTIKQIDVFRREALREINQGRIEGDKARMARGVGNLVKLSTMFVLANAAADLIKDLLYGREPDLDDIIVDNILRLMGMSKYITWYIRENGPVEGILKMIAPPVPYLTYPVKDIDRILKAIEQGKWDEFKFKNLESIQTIPLVGKEIYWWFGGGAEKVQRKIDRELPDKLMKEYVNSGKPEKEFIDRMREHYQKQNKQFGSIKTRLKNEYNIRKKFGYDNKIVNHLLDIQKNDEKVQYLINLKKDNKKFDVNELVRYHVISPEVRFKYNQLREK